MRPRCDRGVGDAAQRWSGGFATVALPMLLWMGTLAAIAVIDLGAYLTAAARAQTLADAVALAAVSADVEGARAVSPIREADRVAVAGGGQLEACACTPGAGRAVVTVSVPVPGIVLPTLGASRVAADAAAALVEPPR
ncbi:MAG: hypothetical protein EA387_15520 [Nitriliruptor sp.]|nr:MAG: hypothetical protein EA387_15520 [Nitriliruptor sp.]